MPEAPVLGGGEPDGASCAVPATDLAATGPATLQGHVNAESADSDVGKRETEATVRHLEAVAAVATRVHAQALKLKPNKLGRLDIGWAAREANIPRSSAYLEPVKSALSALGDIEEAIWLPKLVVSQSAFSRPLTTPEQHAAWRIACAAHERATRQEDVDAALDEIVLWDAELCATLERVPWQNGAPKVLVCSQRLGCSPLVLRHEAVREALVELARRHGVRTEGGSKKVFDSKQRYHRNGLIRDEAEWLRLKQEAFALNARGHVDYLAAAHRLGLDDDEVLKTNFRREIDKYQTNLRGDRDAIRPGMAEFSEREAHSLLDIVQDQVDAGDDCWMVECDRLRRPEDYERRLSLPPGLSNRFPKVRHRCVQIYSELLEGWQQDKRAAAHARRINFIVDGIAALAPQYKANGWKVELDLNGSVSMRSLERALRTRFPGEWSNPVVVGAVAGLVDAVGSHASSMLTVKPDTDSLIATLCRTIKRRGFGFAWTFSDSVEFRANLARETLLPEAEITDDHLDDVEAALAAAKSLGMEGARPSKAKVRVSKGGLEDLLGRVLADPKYDDGLPAHPAGDDLLDYEILSLDSAIEARWLRETPSYAEMISAKIRAVGLKPFSQRDCDITFAQLKLAAAKDRARVAAALAASGEEPMPITYARRVNAVLHEAMMAAGLGLGDRVGDTLHAPRDQAKREFRAGMEIAELRLCYARLIIELSDGMTLPRALGLLCRAVGYRPGTLHQSTTTKQITRDWALMTCVPTWSQEETLSALATHFGMPPSALSDLLNADWRGPGVRTGKEVIPTRLRCHLPFNYWQLDAEVRHEVLNDIAQNYASDDSPRRVGSGCNRPIDTVCATGIGRPR